MLVSASGPGIISFALGLPAEELFPVADYARAVASVFSSGAKALQYSPHFQPLKSHVVELMKLRGVVCREEQVFLTAGAQQGMSLLARLLLETGGKVVTEEIIYTGFQQLLEPFQPEILTVPTDLETGMDVDAVEVILKGGTRPAFIYAIPDGHNPLGVNMLMSKREQLVELACEYGVPIVEDDAYGFLYYEDTSRPPMRALDDEFVLYVGSFSKILAPALRVGWIIAPEKLMRPLSVIKEASDIDTATLTQRVISAYLDSGNLYPHLANLRREYCSRRDAMHEALLAYFPSEARWSKPESGAFIWVELPDSTDERVLLEYALQQEKVAFIPGHAFNVERHRNRTHSLRLNFTHCATDIIEQGVARLARALKYCRLETHSRVLELF
jgi:2-aminoadipate transaminase